LCALMGVGLEALPPMGSHQSIFGDRLKSRGCAMVTKWNPTDEHSHTTNDLREAKQ